MPTARLDGTVIASSDDTVVVEGNHYFAPDDVDHALLRPNDRTTVCPWKGTASYYDVVVDGRVAEAAAWYYPEPSDAAAEIAGRIAFWGDVEVT